MCVQGGGVQQNLVTSVPLPKVPAFSVDDSKVHTRGSPGASAFMAAPSAVEAAVADVMAESRQAVGSAPDKTDAASGPSSFKLCSRMPPQVRLDEPLRSWADFNKFPSEVHTAPRPSDEALAALKDLAGIIWFLLWGECQTREVAGTSKL